MSHDHDHDNELDPFAARVRALETILTRKGLIDPAAIDVIVDTYETRIGPRNGAQVVVKNRFAYNADDNWLAVFFIFVHLVVGRAGRRL